MEHVYLTRPSERLKDQYLAYYQEWIKSGEPFIPQAITKDPSDFQEMLKLFTNEEKGIGLRAGWVSSSTFLLIGEDERMIGAVHIRHKLTEDLLNSGGHIGYGIRPSERRKGFATKLLELALIEAKSLGISKVLVVCDEDNRASAKTISNNNGLQIEDFIEEDGNVIQRFWIDTFERTLNP
ncbi:GNAT family N-acetyltransferase [Jeotgalibacillus marinus]|uniref:GNAT family N-acetyltransferase n=1 Tax=Jeotgalibacillus marinus TaxID=86667 RepID=A0ABV3Q1N9_9BACL